MTRFIFFLIAILPELIMSINAAAEESASPIAPLRYDELDRLPTTVFSSVTGRDPQENTGAHKTVGSLSSHGSRRPASQNSRVQSNSKARQFSKKPGARANDWKVIGTEKPR